MQIGTEMLAGFITLFLAIIGFAVWLGALHQKVKYNRKDIDDAWETIKDFQRENKADHNRISVKLDEIIRNGKRG